jgi:hypothetical protein
MKKIISLIQFILVTSLAQSQVVSNCAIPQLLASEYNKDIVQLATAYLFQTQNADTVFVRVPQVYYDSIAGGLAAIFNATSIPERDSVFNMYCVHDHNGFPGDYAGFLVEIDTNYQWTHAWQTLNTVTGDAYIDYITSTYSLRVVNFYNWSFGQYAELATDSAWNIRALADTLRQSSGVINVDPNYIIGLAGTIEYKVIGTDRYFNFFFEFNDCFDGCDNYHEWSFKVDSNCSVTYIGFTDWGIFGNQPLPTPVNCNAFTALNENDAMEDFEIFPNPVSDKLSLQFPSNRRSFIRIYDVTGREVNSIEANSSSVTIDFNEKPDGIYIVEIITESITSFKKIIKGN